ncbi:anthranilate synthase component II [Corynebacterium striatum]|uniref:anthranilate synthase component II n=1 Tax=Corynebacterium striatum TaxID=43770 RepID=UPI001419BB93|nr:anthranilate synthase component II [Corynebacterium striatum]NHY11382.1 anthranilate synthase component II [Corynebacterium striatum]NHY35216.1 anthranilate synthase component II [Corynebacterium striatum]HAT1131658.1 anthranilate synthase component II [Corynebacterium striatum]HAT1139719.1 anthranilate synthase component II [Corynebacterium striatum]HAT1141955.1 anthranilate synthase component II [Corynebacterium striatum]
MTHSPHVVLIDNHDSFVYNLVDALAGYKTTIFRNTVSVEEILAAQPDIICLSPGPGHPRDAGCMMELIDHVLGEIPLFGICLGFQALLDHHGGTVEPCGPVHGKSVPMTLTKEGAQHPIFTGLNVDSEPDNPNYVGTQVPVARYHSLGCTHIPAGMRALAATETQIGDVVMAAETNDGMAFGVQFHPESVLSPKGPLMLERCIESLSLKSVKGETK